MHILPEAASNTSGSMTGRWRWKVASSYSGKKSFGNRHGPSRSITASMVMSPILICRMVVASDCSHGRVTNGEMAEQTRGISRRPGINRPLNNRRHKPGVNGASHAIENLRLPPPAAGFHLQYRDLSDAGFQCAGAAGWLVHVRPWRYQHRRRQSLFGNAASILRVEESAWRLRPCRLRTLSPAVFHRPVAGRATARRVSRRVDDAALPDRV